MEDRVHRAISADGTEIIGRVQGRGPPLVLVHGSLEDGDLCWASLVPRLRERFTCYTMSTRCRGDSGAHPDVSPGRLVQDVTAFVESIGEPVRLVGESAGGMLALGAAARSGAVAAVAAYEPVVFEVLPEEEGKRLEQTIERVREVAADGRLADAARAFAEPLVNDDELDAISASDYFETSGRYVPVLLEEMAQANQARGYSPTDPAVLERIVRPVLLMRGERTAFSRWFGEGVMHVARHVPDAQVLEIAGAGHWGPILAPEPIAEELLRFFEAAPEPHSVSDR
ncbi:MAG: alpha/beta fold hydrolase [Myxococcota bacterium]